MTIKVKVIVRATEEHPSGYKLSPGFSTGTKDIDHEETISCKHAREHALLFLQFLDVSAYQCGIMQGEFKDIEGWSERFTELVDLLNKMARKEGPVEEQGTLV